MPTASLRDLLRFLRRERAGLEGPDASDGALLERFLAQRDEAAFETLLQRHGAMVLGVCQRVVGDAHAAEDAFQATFLVLARRAGSIRDHASVGSWLYGVAQRIACKARAQATARRARERRTADMARSEPLDELTWQELRSVLDEEVGRLPEKYRAAVVLCHLEGKSYEQAARELGCPKSSLASRLAKAHQLLRVQLVRRGFALSAGAVATALADKATAAPVAALSALNIVKAATCVAAGKTLAAGILSTRAIALAEEAMKTMIGIKGKLVLLLLALGLAAGAGYAGYGAWVGQPSPRADDKQLPVVQEEPVKKDSPRGEATDLHGDPLPPGAIARLGQDRWLHDNASFAAFLPDGKSVVTLSDAIRVFEFPSGKEIRRTTVGQADKDAGPAFGIAALTKDGKIMATTYSTIGIDEIEICLFDIASGKRLPGLKATGGIWAMAFSPDGKHLATTEQNGTIRIWDLAKAKDVRSFGGEEGTIVSRFDITYAPDGKLMATVRMGDFRVQEASALEIWDPATGMQVRTVPSEKVCPAFSRDGKTLAYVMGKSVVLVEAATGKEIGKLTDNRLEGRLGKSGRIAATVFGKDGAALYATYNGGFIEWDIATRKSLRECTTVAQGTGIPLSLSPDGKTLLRGGFGPEFYDLAGGNEITALNHPTGPLEGIQFTHDGRYLFTGGGHKWDAVTGKDLGPVKIPSSVQLPPTPRQPGLVAVCPNGEIVARVDLPIDPKGVASDPKVVLTDAASGKELGQFPLQAPALGLVHMRFSPDGRTIAVAQPRYGKIMFYDVPAAKLRHTLTIETVKFPRRLMLFSLDGKTLAFNADPTTLGFWDTTTGVRIGSLPLPVAVEEAKSKASPIDGAAFSPDGRCVALNKDDGTATLYELATAQPRHTFGMPSANEVSSGFHREPRVAFSPDGKSLARAKGSIVHLWDIQTGRELDAFKAHTGTVNAVAFAPNGRTVASASADGTALIWDVTRVKRPAAPAKALQPGDLEKHWHVLAGNDAANAFDAMGNLIAARKEAVAWIKDRVKPASPLDGKRIAGLIAQLDDQQLEARDKAIDELLQIGEPLVPDLDKALAGNPPLETRRRLEDLRGKVTGLLLQGERLRGYRAVEVLEQIGTPEARVVLQALAGGAPAARLTTSAQAALKR